MEEYFKAIESYDNFIKIHPVDDEVINAYTVVACDVLENIKHREHGLEISSKTKNLINNYVKEKTGGYFWELEKYANDNKVSIPAIDSGYKVYRAEAPYLFESYMFYMEKNRKPEKRFYKPRRGTLKIVVNDLERLENDEIDTYGLSMPSRTGKLISNDTPVLTDKGWKNHGDLSVGDRVIGENGEFVKVTHVFPKDVANVRVHFSDHTYIDCHENHEWVVNDRSKNRTRIVEAKELAHSAYKEGGNTRYRYQLNIPNVIKGEEKELPMNPYVFGVWLGDGTNCKPCLTICNTDISIVDSIKELGYSVGHVYPQIGCKVYEFKDMRNELHKMGLCQNRRFIEKYIPDIYLSASVEQRLELLAGLIDTDGCLRRKENRYTFSTTSEMLRDNVISLISTFGWRVCCCDYPPKLSSSGIQGKKTGYVISFNPTFEIPCRVERKQLKTFSKQRRICITGIENIEPKQGNCISVEGGLYRVGERMKLTHNSSVCIFFLSWVGYRKPGSHSAMGGHSGQLAKRFFRGYDNLVETPEYTFNELFQVLHPGMKTLESKSSDPAEFTINLGDPDEFSTLSCRGIDGTWTGAIDVSPDGYLYVDDLVRDREHSMSPSRMENTYQEYQNKMLDRMNDGAKKLLVGTLWSTLDPLERERKQNEDNPRAFFRKIPALNEKEESNFQYEIKGFSTKYYLDMRDRLDKAEWMAKFMQAPFVREGLTYPIEELRFFNGILPDGKCKTVAICDPAFGGGDSLSMPIGKVYDEDVYVVSWIHDKRSPEFTVPKIVDRIERFGVMHLWIEKNSGGQLVAEKIQKEMDTRNVAFCKIELYSAPVKMHKEEKITGYSDYVKRNFVFLMPKEKNIDVDDIDVYFADSDYRKAIDEMTTWSAENKGKQHDDAPDAISSFAMKLTKSTTTNTVEAISNPFRNGGKQW